MDRLNTYHRSAVGIYVHPWSGLSLTNSRFPEPRGQTKIQMLVGLLTIYDHWEKQLKALGIPYYLRVWLYAPRFSRSQVVCAIGEDLHYYSTTFHRPDQQRPLDTHLYGPMATKLAAFHWEHRLDEVHYDNTEAGSPEWFNTPEEYEAHVDWFNRLLRRPHRVTHLGEPMGEVTTIFSFRKGDVWLGKR